MKSQILSDEWEASAPFGLTKDGEIAPAMAVDKYGDPISASSWDASEFYNSEGQCLGAHPSFEVCS